MSGENVTMVGGHGMGDEYCAWSDLPARSTTAVEDGTRPFLESLSQAVMRPTHPKVLDDPANTVEGSLVDHSCSHNQRSHHRRILLHI